MSHDCMKRIWKNVYVLQVLDAYECYQVKLSKHNKYKAQNKRYSPQMNNTHISYIVANISKI